MKSIEYLYSLVDQSNFTTIGYTSNDKNLKDEFISKLSYIDLREIDPSFSFNGSLKQKIRDIRLDSILNDSEDLSEINFKYILIDYNDLPHLQKSDVYKSIQLNQIVEKLRSECVECGLKVIFTTPTYTSLEVTPSQNLKGGSRSMHIADLAFIIDKGVAKLMKNRFGSDNETISLSGL
jgi:hypothetical protein